jgi:hypothetical protein
VSAQLVDDLGQALDAEYLVEADDSRLALILASRSGMSGSRPPRNPDYNRALTVLLTRLGLLDAVLVDALVDSRYTQQLSVPEAGRRLIKAPIRLALEPDMDALRRRMGTAQARIAQAPGATKGGNATKRIRLRVDVPGYRPIAAAHLAAVLAAPIAQASVEEPMYWWEGEPGENVFMEITRRDDIGANLQAPATARGGGTTASYSLVPLVRPGDVVIHYDSRQEAIVGISVATGSAEPSPIYWVSRGSYARRAGGRASSPAILLASRLPPSGGRPHRGRSASPANPSVLNRLIQRRTVAGWHSSSTAIWAAGNPCSDSWTITARAACRHRPRRPARSRSISSPGPLANTQTGRILTTTSPGGGTMWQPRSSPRRG